MKKKKKKSLLFLYSLCRAVSFYSAKRGKKKMRKKIQFITCASLIYSVQIAICRSNHNVYFLNPQINFILEKNDSLSLSSLTSQNGKTQKKTFIYTLNSKVVRGRWIWKRVKISYTSTYCTLSRIINNIFSLLFCVSQSTLDVSARCGLKFNAK